MSSRLLGVAHGPFGARAPCTGCNNCITLVRGSALSPDYVKFISVPYPLEIPVKLAVRRTSTAIAALATLGVSSMFAGISPAAAAPSEACGADGTLVAPGICELTVTGTSTFVRTAQMTKLEVLLVGAGGMSAGTDPNTFGYAAAGGGGQVKIVDFSAGVTDLDLTVADATSTGVVGSTSVNDGSTLTAAGNGSDGFRQDYNASIGGTSGSGFSGATTTSISGGGGASASSVGTGNGGAGVVVSSIAAPGSLFASDTNCYGGGGAASNGTMTGVATCGGGAGAAGGATVTPPAANSGGGAGGAVATLTAAERTGADGVAVVRWTAATVTLSFSANGHGTAPAAQPIVAGNAGTAPADPTATGYTFDGWYTDGTLATLADFTDPLVQSTTYFAKWTAQPITIAFSANGHGTAPASQDILAGDTATEPADPTATGYTFDGWYTDASLTTLVDFTDPLVQSTTCFAKWTAQPITVTFSANGHGTAPASQDILAGDTAAEPANPTATGYTFNGWYTDATLTTLADFTDPLVQSTTYFAGWTALPATAAAQLAATGLEVGAPLMAGSILIGAAIALRAFRRKPRFN